MKPKHTTHKLTKNQRQAIIDLYIKGTPVSIIAPLFSITKSNIFYILKKSSISCSGAVPQDKKFFIPNAQKITDSRICDYGCGTSAYYIFNNGKVCCSDNPNKCKSKIERILNTQDSIDIDTGLTIKKRAAKRSLKTRTDTNIIKTCQVKGAQTRKDNGHYKKLGLRMREIWDEAPWDGRFKAMFKRYKDTLIPYQGSYEYDFLQKLEESKGIEWIKNNIKRGPGIRYIFENEERLYLPDFLIGNTIYEIKSRYTWNLDREKNCKKIEKCIDLGYNVIVVINKKEMNYEQARLI